MPRDEIMSLHEKVKISLEAIELKKQGKLAEAQKLERSIPLPPYLARWAKKRLGAEFLLENGWNLSEADVEYGPDWLAK